MAAKKTTARKPARKAAKAKKTKAPARRKAASRKPQPQALGPAIRTRLSKSGIVSAIAESRSLTRKDVSAVLDELELLMGRSLRRGGAGEFLLPGLLKVVAVKVPARKARPGVNPFTGEKIMIKARPASRSARVRVLKKLKEYASS